MNSAVLSRSRIKQWVESSRIQYFIITLIVVNAIILGLETSPGVMAKWGTQLRAVDHVILSIFVLEIVLRIYAHGIKYFRDPWGVFDFVVVAIALVPASGPLAVLRALRVLRVLRLISMMPQLRFVVEALLSAIPGISAIAALMVILYYVFAVMSTGLFGATHPEWFGNVGASMYTLFQIMTLESWSMGIVRPLMEHHPYAWVFFIPFILVATFTILNLFIAIIVNTMQSMHEKVAHDEQQAIEDAIRDEGLQLEVELKALRAEISELKAVLLSARRG